MDIRRLHFVTVHVETDRRGSIDPLGHSLLSGRNVSVEELRGAACHLFYCPPSASALPVGTTVCVGCARTHLLPRDLSVLLPRESP